MNPVEDGRIKASQVYNAQADKESRRARALQKLKVAEDETATAADLLALDGADVAELRATGGGVRKWREQVQKWR